MVAKAESGRVTSMTRSGFADTYTYDPAQTRSCNCGSLSLWSSCYVYGSYIDEVLCMVKANGDRYYYSTNDLYSVYALTDSTGTVVERYMFDPYGKVTVLDASGTPLASNESAYGNPWTFTGRRLDGETGLMYFRFRTYDVGLGRFVGRDPIGYEGGGLGLYGAYFVPDGVDPLGLEAIRFTYRVNSEYGSAQATVEARIWCENSTVKINAQGTRNDSDVTKNGGLFSSLHYSPKKSGVVRERPKM